MASLLPRLNSLQAQLALLWLFILLVSLALGTVLVGLYQRGSADEIEAGRRATARACKSIEMLYAANFARDPESKADKDLLNVLLGEGLRGLPGVEGGVWGRSVGNIAYAFPTHEGAISKVDAPADEMPWILSLAQRALAGTAVDDVRRGRRDAVAVSACPLKSEGFAAWTMMRMALTAADAYDRLTQGLGLLLAFVVLSGSWLAYALTRWSRGVMHLEKALAHHPIDELPRLASSGQPDLDRVVTAQSLHRAPAGGARALGRPVAPAGASRPPGLPRAYRRGRRARDPQSDRRHAPQGRERDRTAGRTPGSGARGRARADRAARSAVRVAAVGQPAHPPRPAADRGGGLA